MNGLSGEQEKTATSTSFSTAWMFEEERNKQLCCDRKAKTKSKKKKKKKKRGKKRQGRRKRGVFPFWLLWRAFSIFLFCLLGVFVCWFSDLRAALCVSLLSGHMAHGPEMGVLGHSSTLTGFDRWRRMSAFLG